LEIDGLKDALIKILHDFHIQMSLLEGCREILNGDGSDLSRKLWKNQASGFFLSCKHFQSVLCDLSAQLNRSLATTPCDICGKPLQDAPRPALAILFLCRHVAHATCVTGAENLTTPDYFVTGDGISASRGISGSIAL
jgi:hypothetical protein